MQATERKWQLPSTHIADESTLPKSSECRLTLLLSPDRLFIAIFHLQSHSLHSLKYFELASVRNRNDLQAALNHLFLDEPLLLQRYAEQRAFVFYPDTALIPSQAFKEEELKDLASMSFKTGAANNGIPAHNRLEGLNAELVYLIPSYWQELLSRHLKLEVCDHSSAKQISFLHGLQQGHSNPVIYANVLGEYLEITAYDRQQLLMHNIFRYTSVEDYAYFLMAAYNSLQFDPEQIELLLGGDVDKRSRLYEFAYKFIRNIRFQQRPASLRYAEVFGDMPPQFYFQVICCHL